MIEDVTGLPFDVYIEGNILKPVGMIHSTYAQPLHTEYHSTASAAFDGQGEQINGNWHNDPEHAAAGLWTTPSDLAIYCTGIQTIFSGTRNGILNRETVENAYKTYG
ncbi:MAG: serine hydrolase [Cyclobacteriaceae bacterium]|nr:serine hydrolase [Cyclobacteriaceae bacterium]